jgi:UDP-N-acetylmuramoylalanine--D-glutamate ligase
MYAQLIEQQKPTLANMLYQMRNKTLREAFVDFHSMKHRIEHVAMVRGVEYINDSMACNVNSVWFALEKINNKNVTWIAGGQAKKSDFASLRPLVEEKVKNIICLGLNNKPIISAFGDMGKFIVETTTAEQAVSIAYSVAQDGEIVILSPGCPSFDLFESYQDRGDQFKSAVFEL